MHVNLILMCLIDLVFNFVALYVTIKFDLKKLIMASSYIIAVCFAVSIFLNSSTK